MRLPDHVYGFGSGAGQNCHVDSGLPLRGHYASGKTYRVPRYFFDIHDGHFQPDTEGTECADFEAARREAMISLPEIARWLIPSDGDNQAFTVMVRNEVGTIVYTATLTFAGLRLARPAAV